MVDKKITALTAMTTPAANDVIAMVDDPAGSAETKKITYANVEANLSLTASQISDFDTEVANNSAVSANTAKNTNVPTALSTGTVGGTSYGITSDSGTDDVVLAQADTNNAGVLSAVKWDEIVANTLKDTNVSTNLSEGTATNTTLDVNSSDGTNATLASASTTRAGVLTKAKWDEIVANSLKVTNVNTNITIVEAPTNVSVQSSDGTNDTIAAADVTNAGVMTTTMFDEHVVNTAHAIDNTQAHTDYLLNSGVDTAVGPLTTTADNSSVDTEYIPNVLYNTDATPPTASTVPIGTIYIQYTA